jgi:hypothetical protein
MPTMDRRSIKTLVKRYSKILIVLYVLQAMAGFAFGAWAAVSALT